jgi:hypothetical protein
MTVSEVRELIPLHALGALDGPSAHEVEAYLRAASFEEQREAAEFREVAALLSFAWLAPAAPLALKDQLLQRLSDELPAPGQVANPVTANPVTANPVNASPVLDFKSRSAAGSQPAPRLTQWLALAASLLLAAASVFLFRQNQQLRYERAQLAQALQLARNEITQMQAPATRVFALQGQEAPQASAKVFWDTERQQWVVTIFNLPVPPAGMDYQLWYVTKDAKLSAAVFRPGAQGRYELRLTLPAGVPENIAATAVTLEPQGGSPQPTGKFYLMAQL